MAAPTKPKEYTSVLEESAEALAREVGHLRTQGWRMASEIKSCMGQLAVQMERELG